MKNFYGIENKYQTIIGMTPKNNSLILEPLAKLMKSINDKTIT
jgi:hypothetical protein